MGKKIKKAFSKVTKVATLGAVGPGGWGKQAAGLLTGGISDNILGGANVDTGADANAEALKLQQLMAQNANVDLSTENVADVATAGTADALDTTKKKRKAPSLSSSLGINAG